MRDLADGLYELCPDCEAWGEGCLTCFDEGLVLHRCPGDTPPTSLGPCSDLTRKLYEQELEMGT